MTEKNDARVWHKVLSKDELPEGRVTSVSCKNRTLCMSRYKGKYGALDNKCHHQGGPLGEGSIENGLLRCPWHGWDYDPITGKAPGFDDGAKPSLSKNVRTASTSDFRKNRPTSIPWAT